MRQPAALMVRASFAIATAVAALIAASPSASAQHYLVNGHPASVAQAHYLASQGMPSGDWQIDGWGISPATSDHSRPVVADANNGRCWYVLDVPLGDCGAGDRAIAQNEPAAPQPVQVAATDAAAAQQVRHAGLDVH